MATANKVYIKGMVCGRCISTIKEQLESLGLLVDSIELGEIMISASATSTYADLSLLDQHLKPLGFSVLEDKRTRLVRNVKLLVQEVYGGAFDFPGRFSFSGYLAEMLHKEYSTISVVFSQIEKQTLETYIIQFRIEKAKELLVYTSFSLNEISFRLGFYGPAHLAAQFKKNTGLTPSHFRSIRKSKERLISEA